jgi:hypothetical protein
LTRKVNQIPVYLLTETESPSQSSPALYSILVRFILLNPKLLPIGCIVKEEHDTKLEIM